MAFVVESGDASHELASRPEACRPWFARPLSTRTPTRVWAVYPTGSTPRSGLAGRLSSGQRERMAPARALAVAIRLSGIRTTDHIVDIDQGRIAEVSAHTDLIACGGHYARLRRAQDL